MNADSGGLRTAARSLALRFAGLIVILFLIVA